ncbi:MAG: hypothetical protein KF744_00685 [Taibaiella sp.]|nr:hypothetical protein [Taibaiella sp.]
MTKEEKAYLEAGRSIIGAEESQMFGKPCFKTGGKAFISLFENEMVFKLNGDNHIAALALKGARLFDPSGKGRAMKEWVQVPYTHKAKWKTLAEAAAAYVGR